MDEFAYNNAKNANTSHILLEHNCKYHLQVFYKKDLDLRLKLRIAEELYSELQELMTACQQNIYHAQEFQK